MILPLLLALTMPAAAADLAWHVSASSVAVLAAETTAVYRGGPAGLRTDPSASSTNDIVVVNTEEKDGAWLWTLLPLSTGTLPFTAHYHMADGRALAATTVFLRVGETELPADADISDIKPPLKAWPPLWPWFLAAVLGYGAWYAWKRRRARRFAVGSKSADIPARPPELVATLAIAALQASGLWESDQAAYYLRLTEILREYLEARYGKPVTAMTSAEVARLVKARARDLRVGGSVRELLNRADLVKFARAKAAPDDGPRDADLARSVIKDTT